MSKESLFELVSPKALASRSEEASNAVIIDVREPGEYRRAHIPGSRNVPLSQIDNELESLKDCPKLTVYCETGIRAKQAAKKLSACDSFELELLDGGIQAWRDTKLPCIEDKTAPISIQRQVQITAGSLVALGTLLGVMASPWFLIIPGFVGSGLVFAGLTNTCGMAAMLSKLPYNR